MKNYLSILIAAILFAGTSCEEKIDIEKEKKAIENIIWEETNAFKAKNLERMTKTYVLDESVVRIGASKFGYEIKKGWPEIEKMYQTYFENYPESITGNYEKVNFQIKVNNSSAWAMHDELIEMPNGGNYKQTIIHFLEKHNEEWMVVFITVLDVSSYESLIGTWNLAEMKYIQNGTVAYTLPEGNVSGQQLKIWSNGHFSFVGKFKQGNEIMNNYGGGTFMYDGKFYEENILFHTNEGAVGNQIKMLLEIKNDTLVQTWPVDAEGNFDENNYSVEKYVRLD